MKRIDLYRKYLSRIFALLGGLLIFCVMTKILNYIFVAADICIWERILWHNFYEDDGKIDNLYLGSSHVFCDLNSELLDDINGQYNFNLASGGQTLNDSYYLLKEADKNNNLSHVYLELYYECSTSNSNRDVISGNYKVHWENTDYMKNSLNKCRYVLSFVRIEKVVDTLFAYSRYRTKLDDWDYIRKTVEFKETDASYLNFEYYIESDDGIIEYRKQGYHWNTIEFLDGQRLFHQNRILKRNPIGEKSEKYLRMIISYCKKRDISLTLFISPVDELQLISTEHYDNYINQVRKIAKEYDVDFYDFNLAKEEYLDIQHGEYFMDAGHMNYKGADMFTTFFSEVVSKTPSENEKYFYVSYEEKLQNTAPAIYGLYYRDFDGLRTYHIASNRENGMEYRITLMPVPEDSGGGTAQLIVQEYSKNKEFSLPVSEHGSCSIEARMSGEEKIIQTLTVNY